MQWWIHILQMDTSDIHKLSYVDYQAFPTRKMVSVEVVATTSHKKFQNIDLQKIIELPFV